MTITYTNRRDDVYVLLQGKTKTGKPKYFCSKKLDERAALEMPEGYEFYESPETALVSVRKIQLSRLQPFEKELLAKKIREISNVSAFIIDRQKDSFVIYICDRDPQEVDSLMEKLMGPMGASLNSRDWITKRAHYSPTFQFTLVDEDKRLFEVARWCYRSQSEGWWPLLFGSHSLTQLCDKFLPHLGEETYYDLM